jgi:hypothetical protein
MRRLIVTTSGGERQSPFISALTPQSWDIRETQAGEA